jgi:hypothetical protein
MRPVSIVVASLLTLLVLAGCTKGTKREVVATAKSKKTAELVRTKGKQLTDRGWSEFDGISVEVDGQGYGTGCPPTDKPALAIDPEGRRVAFRCTSAAGFQVIDLRESKGKPFKRCELVPGAALDWGKVPTFEGARVSLLGCRSTEGAPDDNRFPDIVTESKARGGDASVASFLVESADADPGGVVQPRSGPFKAKDGGDDWDRAFEKLGDGDKAKVRASLAKALQGNGGARALSRMLVHGDISDPSSADALEAAGRRMVAAAPSGSGAPAAPPAGFDVIVRSLSKTKPAAAADLACLDAARISGNGVSLILPREEAAIIASQKKQCDLDGIFSRQKCEQGLRCCSHGFTCGEAGRHACTQAELDELVKLELSQPAQNPWPKGGGFGYELVLAAAAAQEKSAAAKALVALGRTCK